MPSRPTEICRLQVELAKRISESGITYGYISEVTGIHKNTVGLVSRLEVEPSLSTYVKIDAAVRGYENMTRHGVGKE